VELERRFGDVNDRLLNDLKFLSPETVAAIRDRLAAGDAVEAAPVWAEEFVGYYTANGTTPGDKWTSILAAYDQRAGGDSYRRWPFVSFVAAAAAHFGEDPVAVAVGIDETIGLNAGWDLPPGEAAAVAEAALSGALPLDEMPRSRLKPTELAALLVRSFRLYGEQPQHNGSGFQRVCYLISVLASHPDVRDEDQARGYLLGAGLDIWQSLDSDNAALPGGREWHRLGPRWRVLPGGFSRQNAAWQEFSVVGRGSNFCLYFETSTGWSRIEPRRLVSESLWDSANLQYVVLDEVAPWRQEPILMTQVDLVRGAPTDDDWYPVVEVLLNGERLGRIFPRKIMMAPMQPRPPEAVIASLSRGPQRGLGLLVGKSLPFERAQ